MKKLFCVIMCFVLATCLAACAKATVIDEKRELASREIPEELDLMIIDNEGTIWVEKEQITGVYVCYEESRGRFLEIRVDSKGEKELKKAFRKKSRELNFVVDGEIMAYPLTLHEHYPNCVIYKDDYQEIMRCFNAIQ